MKLLLIVINCILLLIQILCQKKQQEKPINIKVVPAKSNKLTLDDLDEIKMEVLHDMNNQLKDLEDEMAEKERLKEKTSSTWTLTGAPIYLPRNPTMPSMMMPSNNKEIYVDMKNRLFPEHNKDSNLAPAAFKELENELKEADNAIEELKNLKEEIKENKTTEQEDNTFSKIRPDQGSSNEENSESESESKFIKINEQEKINESNDDQKTGTQSDLIEKSPNDIKALLASKNNDNLEQQNDLVLNKKLDLLDSNNSTDINIIKQVNEPNNSNQEEIKEINVETNIKDKLLSKDQNIATETEVIEKSPNELKDLLASKTSDDLQSEPKSSIIEKVILNSTIETKSPKINITLPNIKNQEQIGSTPYIPKSNQIVTNNYTDSFIMQSKPDIHNIKKMIKEQSDNNQTISNSAKIDLNVNNSIQTGTKPSMVVEGMKQDIKEHLKLLASEELINKNNSTNSKKKPIIESLNLPNNTNIREKLITNTLNLPNTTYIQVHDKLKTSTTSRNNIQIESNLEPKPYIKITEQHDINPLTKNNGNENVQRQNLINPKLTRYNSYFKNMKKNKTLTSLNHPNYHNGPLLGTNIPLFKETYSKMEFNNENLFKENRNLIAELDQNSHLIDKIMKEQRALISSDSKLFQKINNGNYYRKYKRMINQNNS